MTEQSCSTIGTPLHNRGEHRSSIKDDRALARMIGGAFLVGLAVWLLALYALVQTVLS